MLQGRCCCSRRSVSRPASPTGACRGKVIATCKGKRWSALRSTIRSMTAWPVYLGDYVRSTPEPASFRHRPTASKTSSPAVPTA